MSVEFSSAVLSDLQVSLGGSPSYIVVSDFERLANEVAQLRLVANKIASALANPTWVAGDELCRRAATALEHGWYAECEQDSEASIRAYPYRAAPHLLKALAQWHLGKAVDAFECLRACMRYGRIAEADHAATACLLAVNLAAMSGSPAMVRSLLAEGIECTRGRCPQLFVAAVQQGACERDETRACQLLLDDPSAWLKLDVSADLFGLRGSTISSLHKTLVAEIETLMLEAEGIYQKVDLIPAEYFPRMAIWIISEL
jgi:hypothetical protein